MHALLMVQGLLEVVGLFKQSWSEIEETENVTVTLLGVFPTERLAEQVKVRLEQMFTTRRIPGSNELTLDREAALAYMRKHTPPARMSRREAKRTRATIAAAIEIIDDEAERRKLMPF